MLNRFGQLRAALRFAAVLLSFALMPPKTMKAQQDLAFQLPPQSILQLADADLPPSVSVDRKSKYLVTLQRPAYRGLSEIAAEELRLAGLRINPRNSNRSRTIYYTGIAVQEIESGRKIEIAGLPDPLRIEYPRFSPQTGYFSFVVVQPESMTLWVVDLASGKARALTPPRIVAVLDTPYEWLPDDSGVYCHLRPEIAPTDETAELPAGPSVQEADGRKAAGRTYQDLLRNKSDERKFDRYAATELFRVSLDGNSQRVLPPGIYRSTSGSPDGRYLLVEAVQRPYSYQYPMSRFPYLVTVTDRDGKLVREIANKPLQDDIPIAFDAVERGRRGFHWRNDQPATVVWVEALDDGDPARDVPARDRLFQLPVPSGAEPAALCETRERFQRIAWSSRGFAVLSDSRWKTRNVKTYILRADAPGTSLKVCFEYSSEDLYHLPGTFVTAPNERGRDVLLTSADGTKLYLDGEGYSPEGNRPFLDEYEIATGKTQRLWRADGQSTYESIVRVVDAARGQLLTRIESPSRFPNYFLRDIRGGEAPRQLTRFESPFQSLEGVKKEKIRYQRADGVALSADLYLPAGYDASRDGRLPVLMEAYPTEFKNKDAAGMLDSSPHQFIYPSWGSSIFWVTRGYAVLRDAQFPIVGEGDKEPNDTYISQLVANAKAAIQEVDRRGVADPRRVAVMGHSYGAFMTVNLLAHSDLFAAGIARSGAYNRSLTPFGFQSEERIFWQAPQIYQEMSPFNFADKIKTPVLLIHGEADNNPGTFTLQSERLFQAIKGLGGRARLVLLPYESHSYMARENILHMLWEMDEWLETHVKNRKP
jgi:dipeptidyl aminopeptidase/acylaminoacyl peptidase